MQLIQKLKELYPDSSQSQLKKWVLQGRIHLNNTPCKKPHYPLSFNDTVSLEKRRILPLPHKIEILHRDKDLIVIHKPKGLLSAPLDAKCVPNVFDILKREYKPSRVHIVHRLDRDTSGILVFAFTHAAYTHLKEQFFNHSIIRKYQALVEGTVSPETGTWESYLAENEACVVYPTHPDKGKHAITHYTVIKSHMETTQLSFSLQTGRKNQIRVQAQEYGHPVVGDKKYGSSHTQHSLCLHAETLSFVHPITKEKKSFYYKAPFFKPF